MTLPRRAGRRSEKLNREEAMIAKEDAKGKGA
jgi:hypothetical protein